jgi:UDP-glucose 4-epimerase
MKYLVTGGAGFIGSHLVDALLSAGHDVIVLDDMSTGKPDNVDAKAELVKGCICDISTFERLIPKVDGVFHLAAIASVDKSRTEWEWTHQVNLGGMVNLLSVISRQSQKIPVVYASSAAVYGDNQNIPLDADDEVKPLTAYGADKLGCEQHAKVGAVVHAIPSVGCRFFNVYGPRQDPSSPYSGVISIFADRIGRGNGITFFGDGEQTRDFVYVADIVKALQAAMGVLERGKMPQSYVVPICTGRKTSLLQLADVIESLTSHVVEKSFASPRTGDIKHSLGNPALLQKLLGVSADIELKEGLLNTLGDTVHA